MGAPDQYLDGEAFEMRFVSRQIATGNDPLQPKSRLGRVASAILDAFEFLGYDGVVSPFLDRWG
jgi:hypothetical protein